MAIADMKSVEGMTAIEALREIQSQLAEKRAEAVPEGWKTSEQWASEASRATCTTAAILLSGVKAGIVERHAFMVETGCGVRKVWHYRMVEKAAKPAKKK